MPIKFALSIPITDGPHETPELYDEGIPFISAESIKNDQIDFDKKRGYISLEEHKRFSRKYKPQYGDVYMVKSGATTGNVARVETNQEFNIWSPLAVLRPNTDVIKTNFLFYAMKSKPFFYSVELSWSFGTQQNIGMGVISNIRIVLPPPSEQQAIAQFLDRETAKIDTLIAKTRNSIEKLKEYRTALISAAVTGKIDVRND
jgi:type I restriction enzyme S subunit